MNIVQIAQRIENPELNPEERQMLKRAVNELFEVERGLMMYEQALRNYGCSLSTNPRDTAQSEMGFSIACHAVMELDLRRSFLENVIAGGKPVPYYFAPLKQTLFQSENWMDFFEREKAHINRKELAERYPGQYVAIRNYNVVDADKRLGNLARHIREAYGNQPVLIISADFKEDSFDKFISGLR